MEILADNSSAQLVEEVSELCILVRGIMARQHHIESNVSHLAGSGAIGREVSRYNSVVVGTGNTHGLLHFPSEVTAKDSNRGEVEVITGVRRSVRHSRKPRVDYRLTTSWPGSGKRHEVGVISSYSPISSFPPPTSLQQGKWPPGGATGVY